jgi:hypothetical protein
MCAVSTSPLKGNSKSPEEMFQTNLERMSLSPDHIGGDLMKYDIEMDASYYWLRRKGMKRMTSQLAIRNDIRHPFSLQRNQPEDMVANIFKAKASTDNENTRSHFSWLSKRILSRKFEDFFSNSVNLNLKLFHTLRFNVGETCITVVQHEHSKAISPKGKTEVGKLTSDEGGCLITKIACMNAVESYVPPLDDLVKKT